MTSFEDRRAGLLLTSFVAESLSLGVHWIYDPDQLAKMFGYIEEFQPPGENSYHPGKQAGDQGHVGDQALCLADCLCNLKHWNPEGFMSAWVEMWPNYDDYFDHATKTVLSNVSERGVSLNVGSTSDELAGPARMAPLLALLANSPIDSYVKAAIEQTRLTHASSDAEEAAVFLARSSHALLTGAALVSTIKESAPGWALDMAQSKLMKESVDAIGEMGRACPVKASLPAVIYLVLKHGEDLPKALSENAMAGGDNCARGLALGIILGAYHGIKAVPVDWLEGLNNRSRIEKVLKLEPAQK